MVLSGYDAFEEGKKQDVFIKDISGGYYLGQVWPGPTVFPDFFAPNSQAYWTAQLSAFHDMVPVDGLWIDMNEISNFCNVDGTGQVCANDSPSGCPAPGGSQTTCCLSCKTVDPSNTLDFPPYAIHNLYGKLGTKTVAVSATHYNNVTEYDAHNLFGLTEQIATNGALSTIRKMRPFLLSRSSFFSTGVHSAKWTGDNAANWNDLKSSIISVMDFNIFGVPMIGADICGFLGDTNEELCARWIEVGAFYPFVRDHSALGTAPQELYRWASVSEAAKKALGMRYQMLPYLYTLFYQANTQGLTVARPLWMNFPEDPATATIDRQSMLGSGILLSPVLDSGATSVSAYFPKGLWYDFQTRKLAVDASVDAQRVTLSTPLTATNVHIKGGTVLPLQQAAMTTTAGRLTPFTLVAALCPGGQAFGSLFWDDGEQIAIEQFLSVSYNAVATSSSAGSFTGTITADSYDGARSLPVQQIVILGKGLSAPKAASLNGVPLTAAQIGFDASTGAVTFSTLGLALNDAISLTWA